MIAPSTAATAPSRWATTLATGAKRPMQSTGRVVRAPAAAWLRPRSVEITSSSGGTLVIAVRRLAATASRASAMIHTGGSDRVPGAAGAVAERLSSGGAGRDTLQRLEVSTTRSARSLVRSAA